MKIDEAFLQNEVQQAEKLVANLERQRVFAEGGLHALRQLLVLAEQEPPPELE
jgi:hypothetical protein